jgi:hypothetical protein
VGAYLPVFDPNYDLDVTYITPQPNVKSTLLPIVLKAFNPAPGGWSGYYAVTPPNNVKLFLDPAGTIPVDSSDFFLANRDTPLWVAGLNQGTDNLGIFWSDFTHSAGDQSKMSVFTWSGPRDVPGTSRYTYGSDGGMPGANNSMWVAPNDGGTMFSNTPSDTGTDKAEIKWERGPIVGHGSYQAAPGYIWDMGVNVVRVEVVHLPLPGDLPFEPNPNSPKDGGNDPLLNNNVEHNVFSKWIVGNTGVPAVKWAAQVWITGPSKGRGIDKIQTGFIQVATSIGEYGFYANTTNGLRSSLSGLTPMLDEFDELPIDYPWYVSLDNARFTASTNMNDTHYNHSTGIYKRRISSDDSPIIPIPLTLQKDNAVNPWDNVLAHVAIHLNFMLDISSRTLDPTLNNEGNTVFTKIATAQWLFDGSGNIGPGPLYPFTGDIPWGIYAPNAWTIVTDGSRTQLPARELRIEKDNNQFNEF